MLNGKKIFFICFIQFVEESNLKKNYKNRVHIEIKPFKKTNVK